MTIAHNTQNHEKPGIAHDQNGENALHQTKDFSIQDLTHCHMAAAQVADTKPILIDRMQIELTEAELCHIVNHHIHSENLKECYKLLQIWRSVLTQEEIGKLLAKSISLGRVNAVRILAKLRGEKLSSEEKSLLIISCINHGWYYQSPYKEELRAKILNLRLIPVLKFKEKIAVYEMCKKKNWQRQANIFAIKNPITFLTHFLNLSWNKIKEFVPTEEQITAYSKM